MAKVKSGRPSGGGSTGSKLAGIGRAKSGAPKNDMDMMMDMGVAVGKQVKSPPLTKKMSVSKSPSARPGGRRK